MHQVAGFELDPGRHQFGIAAGFRLECMAGFVGIRNLIEPVACTPASGWEKGQVENQVGNLRDQMFRPKPRVKVSPS